MKKSIIDNIMLKRKERLLEIIASIGEIDTSNTEESLEVRKRNDSILYYRRYRDENRRVRLKYIKDIEVAKRMAQSFYDRKVIQAAKRELDAISRYELRMPLYKSEDIYEKIHVDKRKIIKPIELPADEFIANWYAVEYQKKGFSDDYPEYRTIRGERMRSKSEIMIADMLHNKKIPYKYECPLNLKGFGTVYPDFTLINVETRREIYWEHFGLIDLPEYAVTAMKKLSAFEQNGLHIGERLIVTFEKLEAPLSQQMILDKIEKHLM